MLESKKSIAFTPAMKRATIVLLVVAVLSVAIYAFLTRDRGTLNAGGGTSAGQGAVQVKSTAFNGVDINTDDPAALRAYCEDIIASGEVSGDKIRDLCVLNDIVRTHLPNLSTEEIQDLAQNQPSCLQTGYDADGFNCFTGFDENNCSREGLDPEGNVCDPSLANQNVKNPIDSLFGSEADVCSIVSGCQAEAEFDENGMNRFGCNREGRREDGSMCPAEYITRIYGDDNRDQLGFDPAGFNENGCDIQGIRADGTRCPIEQVTRVFDRNNRDQWGFDQDGFNENGCTIEGLGRDGNACAVEDITRIIDPKTGLDQFGLDADGFNENGCSLDGFNREGLLCDLEDITRIQGKDGKDQFGLYKNGRNDAGCDLDGLKPDGSACTLEEAPRLFSEKTGKDQFGFYKNNKNDAGCDANGMHSDGTLCPVEDNTKIIGKDNLDAHGITLDGYAKNGCNTEGFRRNGTRCAADDIPRIYDALTKLDQFGLDEEGFDPETGCNLEGFDRNGERCDLADTPRIFDPETGFDQFGFSRDGFNESGCDINGLNAMGKVCASDDITRVYDPETGLDQFGLDKEGFDPETGCNLEGYNREGNRCSFEDIPKIVGKDGVNQLGLTSDGRNAAGCDINGTKPDGSACSPDERTKLYGNDGLSQYHKDSEGYSRLGINDMQYNEFNCNLDGQKPNGELCEIDEIPRVYDPVTGLDQFGLTKDGFNEFGCSLEGNDRNGDACPPEHIPRIFSSDMKDQFGTPIEELPDDVWLAEQAKKEGLTPLLDENGNPVFKDGKAVMVGKDGVLRDANGVAFRDEFGGVLKADKNGNVTNSRGQKVPAAVFEDERGGPASGPFKLASADGEGNQRLVGSKGEGVSVYGEEAFVDEQGFLVDDNGNYITGKDGKPLRLDTDGNVVDSSGNRVEASAVTDAKGNIVKGPLSKQKVAANAKLSSLTDRGGEPILIDGKPAYVDENGNLMDADGNPILSENGLPLRLDANGKIVDALGAEIEEGRATSLLGEEVDGPFTSKNLPEEGLLTNADGEVVLVDGKAAYVGKDGILRDAQGNILTGSDGAPLRLDSNGRIVDSSGKPIEDSRLTTSDGEVAEGPFESSSPTGGLLTDGNSKAVLIDGKAAFVGEDGLLRDSEGNVLLGRNGEPLSLDENGNVVDSKGNAIAPSRLTNVKGNRVSGPFSVGEQGEMAALTTASGETLVIHGKEAFVRDDGVITDVNGNPILGSDGKPLRLNENGEVVDSQGRKVSGSRLTTVDGEEAEGALQADIQEKRGVLTNAAGEAITIDGQEAFVGDDGIIIDANGNPILGADGKPLRLNANGEVVDSRGRKIRASRIKTIDGEPVTGPLHVEDKKSNSLLTDTTGQPVLIDGKAAFVDEEGFLRDAQGNLFKGEDGKPLRMNAKGEVVDAEGNVISDDRLSTVSGKKVRKPLKAKNKVEQDLLTTADGKPVMVDGKVAYVDSQGNLRDADGKLILGDDGKPLTLDKYGRVVDSNGKAIDADRVKTLDGKIVTGPLKAPSIDGSETFTPLIGEDGGIVHYNGEPIMVGKDGKLRNMDGELILGPDGEPLYLDGSGQVVTASGKVIPAESFTDSSGKALSGAFKADNKKTKAQVEAALKADVLTDEQRSALGLDSDGYNEAGCDLNGLDRNGKLCSLEDIPRVFDEETGLDQFGLGVDGFNSFGCNLEGVNRQGEPCEDSFVTRIRDAEGFDQFGVDSAGFRRSGLNENAENNLGCDAAGENCSVESSPQLTDSNGANQFGKKPNGTDRLNLVNGFNEKGCNLDGLKASGERCAIEDIPRFYNESGVDQFGVSSNGFNANGCNLEGLREDGSICPINEIPRIFDDSLYDQFGLNSEGRNAAGCDLSGFKADGTPCAPEDIPRIYDANGIDQLGFDKAGYDAKGCDVNGYRKDGTRCAVEDITRIVDPLTGLDQFGIDSDGFNQNGCSLEGIGRDGKLCKFEDITRVFDEETGKDQFGFGKDGFNDAGCDFYGYNRQGQLCKPEQLTRVVGADNKDQFGIDQQTGLNEKGCDIHGLKKDGSRCKPENVVQFVNADGTDRFGLTNGVNQNGCDINGLKEDGSLCDIEDVTRIIDEETGRDQFGLDDNLLNEHGCGIDGLNVDGNPCDPDELTHLYNGDNVDQFGLDKSGKNIFECNLLGFKPDGSRCSSEELTSIRGTDGYDQLGLDPKGFNANGEDLEGYDINGCDAQNKKRDGSFCSKTVDYNLDSDDAEYMAKRREEMSAWLAEVKFDYKQEVESPYMDKAANLGSISAQAVAGNATPVSANPSQNQEVANNTSIAANGNSGQEAGGAANAQDIRIPMAYMTQVNVTTPVNSDYTESVYARITLGELAGAVLVGRVVVPYIENPVMPRDKFYYEFTSMIYERQTIPIDAVSINPYNDSSMVDADDVDYHRFQRYGGLLFASAIEALDATFLDNQVQNDLQAQEKLVTSIANASVLYGQNSRELAKKNLQTATSHVSDLAKQQFTRRPTIKSGPGLTLIVFRKENTDPRLPYVMVGVEH